jgi:tetratricopeptide (TPR) repeat protein
LLGLAAALCALAAAVLPSLHAQGDRKDRLIDQEPYDIVTLNEANEGKVYKVHPLDVPGRRVPAKPKASDRLRIKLVEDGSEYEVAWYDLAKVEFFEEIVLAEAKQLATDGKFDQAYDNLQFLLDFYPHTQGLEAGRQDYLYLSAGASFRQQEYDEALAALEELLSRNPSYRAGESSPTLMQVLGSIADRMLAGYVEQQDYASARTLLARLTRQYRADGEPFAERWRKQLVELATTHLNAAREHLGAGRFVEAYDASVAMQQVWPELPGGQELIADIARRYPLVIVGVDHPALAFDSRSLHDVAARRAGRLSERLLMEFTGLGPEGGQYTSPLGTIAESDDGRQLRFRLSARSGGATPYDLSQFLLHRAQPSREAYLPEWQRIVDSVSTRGTTEVQIDLRAGHVLPQALLQVPIATAAGANLEAARPYAILAREAERVRYSLNPDYAFRQPGQPAEIVERHFSDPQRALLAIQRGEIDVLDRVFPGDIAALRSNEAIAVAPYRAPTTHVLARRSQHPYLANRTFRRALVYGSNRELILRQGILRGQSLAGFRVVSAPFPAPSTSGDLPAYGYDLQIDPREYDPRLGLTLRILAEGEIKAAHEKLKQQVPPLTPIVLGHPADETSRIACRALAKQWKMIRVECQLVEFPAGVFDDAEKKCDLVYLQLAAWEPIVDAGLLLGEGGLAPAESDFVQLTLRQIDESRNWQQARDRLLHLHRLLHEDVTVWPLFQTMDHFAFRRSVQGISAGRVRLYQDVEQWQVATQLARSTP